MWVDSAVTGGRGVASWSWRLPTKQREGEVELKAVVLRRFAGAAADDDDLAAALDLSRPRRPEPPRGRQLLTVDALSARITQQAHVACVRGRRRVPADRCTRSCEASMRALRIV